ncbi:MAG: two-component regulator propeller domain-containing protein, partial [Bacteroidales bacterium]
MSRKRFSALVWILFLLYPDPMNLYASELRFRHLIINDGLSQNAVYTIHQDASGYMWFGTKD